jgi:hypothetical protein
MAIRDWFTRKQPATPPAPPPTSAVRFHRDRSRMFDIGKTAQLGALFAAPRDGRDAAWVSQFWDAA